MSSTLKYYDNLSNEQIYLRDFAHASALYRRNNYRLAPKSKFLYHININVNQQALASLGPGVQNLLSGREFNLLSTQVDLPSYNFSIDTKNQYNRKKLIQTKVDYNPINFTFHDDNAGITTLLWEAYFRYYYQDPNYTENSVAFNKTSLYKNDLYYRQRIGLDKDRPTNPSGDALPFFDKITIYQMHPQHGRSKYTSYTLINPMIESFEHDSLEYSDMAGLTTNTMRLRYEAVLYDRDRTDNDNPAGFALPDTYDVRPSVLKTNVDELEIDLSEVFANLFGLPQPLISAILQTDAFAELQNNEIFGTIATVINVLNNTNTQTGSAGIAINNTNKTQNSTLGVVNEITNVVALLGLTGQASVSDALTNISSNSVAANEFGFGVARTFSEETLDTNSLAQEDIDEFRDSLNTANAVEGIEEQAISQREIELQLKNRVDEAKKLTRNIAQVSSLNEKKALWNAAPAEIQNTIIKAGYRELAKAKRGAARSTSNLIG